MASLGILGEPSAKDDETLSVSAVTDIELDSTGAGSPPPSTFEQDLPSDMAQASSADSFAAGPTNSAATTTVPHLPPAASQPTLESALGEILVISGGSGYNDLVGATPGATYVMPISDNGGSSSEIIRVLGGPSIGDLRSRLNRLIPTPSRHDSTSSTTGPLQSNEAIHNLLSYRLPSIGSSREIKQEWMDILEGRHPLWRGIEPERKEVIRGFLVHFESEVLRCARRHFNFRGGSVGNFFLAAAQKFFRSIQSAIFLFSATTQINTSGTGMGGKVLPVINTNHTATIAAELEDGEMVVGQCEISHPAPKKVNSGVKMGGLAKAMERGGSLGSQPPGTPSSAVWDPHQAGLLSVDSMALGDGGPSTPGFGPQAHYHINEPFASNYTSMNASMDAIKMHNNTLDASTGRSGASSTPARSAAGPSPLFAQLVDERAAAHARSSKGLTTVGNQKDGLDPEDDDQDSQDGHDQTDSPRDDSAAEDDHPTEKPSTSHLMVPTNPNKAGRKEKTGNIIFSKTEDDSCLPSPIRRIMYVNAYRNEIYPAPNPSFVTALARSKTIIYSCGSLWTSLVPCLSLRSVASSIATSPTLQYKVLLLNTVQDRETRGMHAVDFITAICGSLNRSDHPTDGGRGGVQGWKMDRLITHLVYFEEGEVKVDRQRLETEMGVRCVAMEPRLRGENGLPMFDEGVVREALVQITRQSS